MKVILTAASAYELKPLLQRHNPVREDDSGILGFTIGDKIIEVLITGIGLVPTAYHLGRILSLRNYDLAVNAGICGSYHKGSKKGEVFEIISEFISDTGAEDHQGFQTLADLALLNPDRFPYSDGLLLNNHPEFSAVLERIPKAKGATVSTIPGKPRSPGKELPLYEPDTESMEGAAFFYACLMGGIPFLQIRAVSNHVSERDKTKWDIPGSVGNLNDTLEDILSSPLIIPDK